MNKLTNDDDSMMDTMKEDLNTLDEPVSQTIARDCQEIGIRLRAVLLPYSHDKDLRNWDLWGLSFIFSCVCKKTNKKTKQKQKHKGPLIFCLLLACTMSFGSSEEDSALVFTAVFVIVWCGAAVVTANTALLGGKISFFQSVCVLGYCIFPLNMVGCPFFILFFIFV